MDIKKINLKKYFCLNKVVCTATIISVLLLCSMSFFTGCAKKEPAKTEGASVSVSTSTIKSDTTAIESSQSSTTQALEQQTTTTQKQETEEPAAVPEDIKKAIDEADNYYNEGYYSEASSAYRSAKAKIKSSELSEDDKDSLLEGIEKKSDSAGEITNTARMHYGNAMQLEYEKRIEEAIEQLEAALKIYPKYQDAIDALESIKSIYNLK